MPSRVSGFESLVAHCATGTNSVDTVVGDRGSEVPICNLLGQLDMGNVLYLLS